MSLWSTAVYDLGLSTEGFFALTPRQFQALHKRHKYKTEWTELLFGQIASIAGNTGFRQFEKPVEVSDFMPSKWGRKQAPVTNDRNDQTLAARIRECLGAS